MREVIVREDMARRRVELKELKRLSMGRGVRGRRLIVEDSRTWGAVK